VSTVIETAPFNRNIILYFLLSTPGRYFLTFFLTLGACGSSEPKTGNEYLMRGMQRGASGDMSGAVEDYTNAIRLKPENAAFYATRAMAYDMMGEYQLAVNDYERAIEIQPQLEAGLKEQLGHLRAKANI
jgi:Tfp pilus assembly protein PilF